jgi:hypothetical protein
MKILLQNKKTGGFVEEAGSWTTHIQKAFTFLNSDKAVEFAVEHRLSDVHLVLWFEELHHRLTIPLQGNRPEDPGRFVSSPTSEEMEHA